MEGFYGERLFLFLLIRSDIQVSISQGLFITGTDTEIGKTYVAGLFARACAGIMPVTYLKPVQTGCTVDENGKLWAPDFEYLKGFLTIRHVDYAAHVPYRFRPACSPHCAAKMAGEEISIQKIQKSYANLARDTTFVLVEGAGGILVPVNDYQTMLDIMKHLALPVVLVTSPKLGTLNHTLMSLEMLKQNGLSLAALVFNNAHNREKDFIYKNNLETLQKSIAPAPFLEIDYTTDVPQQLKDLCNELKK
ncbi:MAG: dethiobiotin synthase [Chitinivibrionales bacterium]|nr:dethiobiotin synthase [Chitinivibrionales bacterium]